MNQRLLWIPQVEQKPGGPLAARGFASFEGTKPDRVWTLPRHTSEQDPPELPYTPVHMRTAFLEDYVHDWRVEKGGFWYYSRVHDLYRSGVWLLLEWEDNS